MLDRRTAEQRTYDSHTVVVDVCLLVKLLLNLGVLGLGPKEMSSVLLSRSSY